MSIFSMTTGSSMQAITLTVPSHSQHVSVDSEYPLQTLRLGHHDPVTSMAVIGLWMERALSRMTVFRSIPDIKSQPLNFAFGSIIVIY